MMNENDILDNLIEEREAILEPPDAWTWWVAHAGKFYKRCMVGILVYMPLLVLLSLMISSVDLLTVAIFGPIVYVICGVLLGGFFYLVACGVDRLINPDRLEGFRNGLFLLTQILSFAHAVVCAYLLSLI